MSRSPDEAVEKSVSGGLRRRPCRRRFADHAQPLNETDENSGGTCRLNAISQLARNLRPGKGISHPRLHDFEKVRDATTDFSILASQFHGCGHQQASAPPLGAGRALDVASKVGPQAVDRLSAEVKFDIHPCQGIGNVAIKRTQKERVLVTESGVKAAARELRRTKKVREGRGVITARPEHAHRAFDSGFHVKTAGAATGQLHWGLAAHHRYIDQSVFNSQVSLRVTALDLQLPHVGGNCSNCGSASPITCHGAFERTKICALGVMAGGASKVPSVTCTYLPSRTTEYSSEPHFPQKALWFASPPNLSTSSWPDVRDRRCTAIPAKGLNAEPVVR